MQIQIGTYREKIERLEEENRQLRSTMEVRRHLPFSLSSAAERSSKINTPVGKNLPPEVRTFALTLHFLSPRAYSMVRKEVYKGLTHPRTLARWYESVDCAPSFMVESLNALKVKKETSDHRFMFSDS